MGLIGRAAGAGIASAGDAAEGLSEVFVANATRKMELSQDAYAMAQQAAMEEFRQAGSTPFDRVINGLNRMPRPLMALGTLGLFVFAMVEPEAFALRMVGLSRVPEPLWWLLGAVVGFYFGARELHYLRQPGAAIAGAGAVGRVLGRRARRRAAEKAQVPENAALSDWFTHDQGLR